MALSCHLFCSRIPDMSNYENDKVTYMEYNGKEWN